MRKFNASRLREIMKAEKVTGRQLAARVGLTNVSISRILHGRQQPSRANAAKIARVFGLGVDDFYRSAAAAGRPGNFDGRALAALRKSRGISPQEVAQQIGRDVTWLKEIESARTWPDAGELARLAEALDVAPEQLQWRPAESFRGQRLREARQRRGVGPHALAAALAIEAERLLLWEADEETPSVGELQRTEQILGLAPGALRDPSGALDVGELVPPPAPDAAAPQRQDVVERIRRFLGSLTVPQCQQVLAYAQGLASQRLTLRTAPAAEAAPPAATAAPAQPAGRGFVEVSQHELPEGQDWRPFYVPVVDAIAAGAATETTQAEDYPPGWAESFVAYRNAPEGSFAVRVSGDSMTPQYRDGDMIVVAPHREARGGETAVVVYEDPTTGVRLSRLKRLRLDSGMVVLESLNPDYPPVEIDASLLIRAWPLLAHLPRA